MKPRKVLGGLLLLFAVSIQAEEIRLKDGTVLQGERVRVEDDILVFRTDLGEMRIPIDHILGTRPSPPAPAQSLYTPPSPAPASRSATPLAAPVPAAPEQEGVDPSGQTLVLMPTAFTPPEGTWNFKDFELFFLTLSYSPTSSTSIAAGALFPVAPSKFEIFTLGIKQRIFQTPDGLGAFALDGDILIPTGENVDANATLWTFSFIGSARPQPALGIHGEVGIMGASQGDGTVVTLALGTDMRLTPHVKFIAEFLRGQVSGEDGAGSLLNLGFRIHGERLSADICGLRPLVDDAGDLFLYPLINIGYRF